jgi:hypothetical protein
MWKLKMEMLSYEEKVKELLDYLATYEHTVERLTHSKMQDFLVQNSQIRAFPCPENQLIAIYRKNTLELHLLILGGKVIVTYSDGTQEDHDTIIDAIEYYRDEHLENGEVPHIL